MRSRLFFTLLPAFATIIACAGSSAPVVPLIEAGTGPGLVDAGVKQGDTGDLTPLATTPSLVLVNGLVTGGKHAFKDVRICLGSSGYARPDDRTMPLSNMPGVARGTGIDLGQVPSFNEIHVFQAGDVDDASWFTTRSADCGQLLGGGALGKDHVTLPFSVGAATVGVLVDDASAPDGIAIHQAPLPPVYKGSTETLEAVVADFSTLRGTHQVQARLDLTLVSALDPLAQPPPAHSWVFPAGGYDQEKVAIDVMEGGVVVDEYEQTLGSIQYASDPTLAPGPFFDRRDIFLFVLVGQPADRHVSGGVRDTKFDGTGLHFAAVPYSATVLGGR